MEIETEQNYKLIHAFKQVLNSAHTVQSVMLTFIC